MKIDLQSYRKAVRWCVTILFLGIPFIKMDGESLLRFDIPTLRLFAFGKIIWIEDFFSVLLVIFVLTFLLISITQLFGRVWCGWLCPQTLMVDFTRSMNKKNRKFSSILGSHLFTACFSIVISACLTWYFVSPYQFFEELSRHDLNRVTLSFWVVLSIITYINFAFFRRGFCTTVCPYAQLQGIMFDEHTMAISMIPERRSECIQCLACVKTCQTGIDIRKGFNHKCINCAECIGACEKVMRKKGKTSLIGYVYGLDNKPNFFRPSVLITGSLFCFFLVLFLFRFVFSPPFDFEVYPAQKFMPMEKQGKIINGYDIRLTNKTTKDITVMLSIPDVLEYEIIPENSFFIGAGESKKEIIYISLPENVFGKYSVKTLNVKAEQEGDDTVNIYTEAGFRKPIRRNK